MNILKMDLAKKISETYLSTLDTKFIRKYQDLNIQKSIHQWNYQSSADSRDQTVMWFVGCLLNSILDLSGNVSNQTVKIGPDTFTGPAKKTISIFCAQWPKQGEESPCQADYYNMQNRARKKWS